MVNQITLTGMILTAAPIGEYDRRVVILTRERGKISAFARGARRPNSALMGVTSPFSFGEFTVYEGRTSYTLVSASISNYFQELRTDVEGAYYGFYFMDLAGYYAREANDETEMLKLLYQTLRALTNVHIPNELIRCIYELKTITVNGEGPQVMECIMCGDREREKVFSIRRGGVICTQCAGHISDGIRLLPSTLYTLQYIVCSPVEKLYTFVVKEDVLKEAVNLIQSLDPRPGQSIQTGEPEYVIPDVLVRKHNGHWTVELNSDSIPRLQINQHYASMCNNARNDGDSQFIRSNLQDAKWLIKSLESRNDTLLRVSRCIVEQQQAFFEQGEEYMKPMVLADIAQAVEMHESTISRVTTQKYLHSPRGIFELKYLFSSHVNTEGGGEASSTAIRALVKKLIAAENPAKPLSDSKLTSLLSEQGIMVARRTVAKYRESLSIPPSNQRKQLV